MMNKLVFDVSPVYILACIITGLLYAIILYKRKYPWNKKVSVFLGLSRFVLVFILSFLLLGPLLRQIRNTRIKPTAVIAIDNSISIDIVHDSLDLQKISDNLNRYKTQLETGDYDVEIRSLSQKNIQDMSGVEYNHGVTDLYGLFQNIRSDYENRNLSLILLVTDGIYNSGSSPAFNMPNAPILTIGLGDTTHRKDVILNQVYHNKIAYQGNVFPIIAEIYNHGFIGDSAVVEVIRNNAILRSETIHIQNDNDIVEINLDIEADESGMQHYVVRIKPLRDEYTTKNNTGHVYIDVIEGREKILIFAGAPHPDIKALKTSIEKNQNYEVILCINGIQSYKEDQYDLVILYQLPDRTRSFQGHIDNFISNNTPILYVTGSKTDIRSFNRMNPILSVNGFKNQPDRITPKVNPDFKNYKLLQELPELISEYPPIYAPYGNYVLKGNTHIVLYQQIGSIVTTRPLIGIKQYEGRKDAVIMGEGFWQWRLMEYAKTQKQIGFDDIIQKLVQYLSSKEDKRRFRVYPVKNEFQDNESVVFEAEMYNDIYERIYGFQVDLELKSESDNTYEYDFVTSEADSRYTINGLESGIYNYSAKSNYNEVAHSINGVFSVRPLQLENLSLVADHSVLRDIAKRSGGKFISFNDLTIDNNLLEGLQAKTLISSSENLLEIIHKKWIFFVLLLLVTIEWVTRKYLGGY